MAKEIPSGAKVLHIGVGRAELDGLLIEKGIHLSCLDPSEKSIEAIRKRYKAAVEAKVGYSQDIPFADASFDYLVMSEVLEHLDTGVLEKTLSEVRRTLRRDGRFIGTIPADENLEESMVVCPKCGDKFHRWGHQQRFSADRISVFLKAHFKRVSIRRMIFSDPMALNWKGKIFWIARYCQAALQVPGSHQHFFFEAFGY